MGLEMLMNNALVAVLCLCLVGTVLIVKFTLASFEGRKRIPFLALLAAIFLTVVGYLLEITANSADGGFVAIKLLYSGMMFLPVAYLVFAYAFCEAKLHKAVIWAMAAAATVISALIWTTGWHGLIYESVGYVVDDPIHHIETIKGPAYFIIHAFPIICAVATLVMLAGKLVTWHKKYRINILMLIIGILIPASVDLAFLVNVNELGVNYAPALMTIVSLLLYINIVRNNLFDILPEAKEIALRSIKEAFILVDKDKVFLHANEAAVEIIPVLGTLSKGSGPNQLRKWPFELKSDENDEIITPVKFSMPDEKHYNASISPLIGDKHELLGYIIIIQDMTESVLLTKKLEELAYSDALTGIMTRQHFMDLASGQFERAKRTNGNSFIIMFDVDRFKNVNDTYGHLVGDKVLKCVADRVQELIRPYDLFGRYGGEEFILFISDINEEDVMIQAERVRLALCDKIMAFDGAELTVSASFGVASILSEDDLTQVVKLADEALYTAKREGRNRVIKSE